MSDTPGPRWITEIVSIIVASAGLGTLAWMLCRDKAPALDGNRLKLSKLIRRREKLELDDEPSLAAAA